MVYYRHYSVLKKLTKLMFVFLTSIKDGVN